MAAQVLEQSGGTSMFSRSSVGISSDEEICGLNYLSKNDLTAAPQLVMLANVALTGDISCYDYHGEVRQMAELKTVNSNLSDNEDDLRTDVNDALQPESLSAEDQALSSVATKDNSESFSRDTCDSGTDSTEVVSQENLADKRKKPKPFRCRPCQYEAESKVEFVHHIKVHSAKKFIVEENAEKQTKSKVPEPLPEETDISKGPIRCDRCGYNTNRYDHYLAHLKHHDKVGENEKVYKCTICTYTTVSEYHWRKHLRNHFPRKIYTCSQCSYFSDRKNNYVQHMRTHTGEQPYKCPQCPYSSSQKTHLTRHMRTHSGEKPFKCDQCNYVASNQHEVTRHARQVHNGPKPLTCPHCEYKTADRSNFKKHVELHVNPRQFLCPVCEYAASKKCNLQYHIKSKHPHCSDITMDVSKVKLRTKRVELDIPVTKMGKKMSDKLQPKRAENPEEKISPKPEKSAAVSKEQGFTLKTQRMKTRNHKVSDNKIPSKKRETNAEKVRKTKGSKRKICSTDVSLQEKSAVETCTEVKKRKVWKAKESVDRESKRSKVKLEKSLHKKNLKCKQSQKKHKRNKNTPIISADDSEKSKKPDQPEHQQNLLKKKSDYSRSSSFSNPSAEDVHKRDTQGSEPMLDILMTEISVNTAVEQNDMQSAKSTCGMLTTISKEPQMSPDQLTDSKSEEQMFIKKMNKSELLSVEEPPVANTEQIWIPSHTSGKKKYVTNSAKACITDSKEMSEESRLASDFERERAVQVSSIEFPNSYNPIKDQNCIDHQMEDQTNASKQMAVQATASVQMSVQASAVEPMEVQTNTIEQMEDQANALEEVEDQANAIEKMEVQASAGDELEVRASASDELEIQASASDELQVRASAGDELQVRASAGDELQVRASAGDELQVRASASEQLVLQASASGQLVAQSDQKKLEFANVPANHDKHQDSANEIQDSDANQHKLHSGGDKVQNSKPDQNKKQNRYEMVEMDEDEGIHSHEGSDISEDSEGSDDSGLNGAKSIPDDKANKRTLEKDVVDTPESFVCIFCDRIFSVKGEFTKHLNRHLVNVYYLEEATKGQE
ncbi:RE1-silencing transcription factor [Stegostoma tigrinum]|uniref:RE1-silencing transcription factor n=1 Tax=Stegostoma tigrinum TaxID=3053191 RepID=UPI00202ADD6D|nr:RE1-silencing transcription factor [Stegostoma tigrinum]